MSYKLNELCETANVKQSEKTVLSKLCDRANEKNNYKCWPSIGLIAENIGRSPRTVQRAIKSLELKGYISIEKQCWSTGVYPSNVYTIIVEKLETDLKQYHSLNMSYKHYYG